MAHAPPPACVHSLLPMSTHRLFTSPVSAPLPVCAATPDQGAAPSSFYLFASSSPLAAPWCLCSNLQRGSWWSVAVTAACCVSCRATPASRRSTWPKSTSKPTLAGEHLTDKRQCSLLGVQTLPPPGQTPGLAATTSTNLSYRCFQWMTEWGVSALVLLTAPCSHLALTGWCPRSASAFCPRCGG